MSDAARRTARTVLQSTLALAAGLPLLIDTAGLSRALPGVGVALTVATVLTRLMALPAVDRALPPWLRTAEPPKALPTAPPPPDDVPPEQP
ncbi:MULTISPECIES: hypothetical protein [Kitasatospora]|uniref:hypothetical protein n=1 Tax=Kitasatospora TaxID=2063 RepID=UPI0022500674|nr:hypothetical protein [Kitasatospora sp. NBC_00240]MCX5208897.1 hypothetical protein [Kitasatospora sp. NBC_00240]